MTVNEMLLLSKVFLGMMIFFLITSIVVFYALDVRKAWCMLTGKRMPVKLKERDVVKKTKQAIMQKPSEAEEEATTLLQKEKSSDNHIEGYNPTTVLVDNEGATTVLTEMEAETTVLSQDKRNNTDIVMDITFIHTEVML